MKLIKLTRGYFVKVDDDDFDWLSKYKWSYMNVGYAVGWVKGSLMTMHVLINKTPKGFETDHINQDKLDNRKSNLRTVDKSINLLNGKIYVNNTSGIRGLCWLKKRKKWRTYISFRKKTYFVGEFKLKEEAILARREKEKNLLMQEIDS